MVSEYLASGSLQSTSSGLGSRTQPEPAQDAELSLPEGWRVISLAEVTEKPKQVDPRRTPSVQFRYVDVSSVSRERLTIVGWEEIKGAQAPSRARKLVKEDDIIFATVRPGLKRIAMVPDHLDGQICSTGFCVIRCVRQKVHPTYVYFAVCLPRFVESVAGHQRGSSYPAVTDKQILREQIPLPPLDEQRRIARVLSTIQRAIEAQDKVIAAAGELKRSLMKHLFTYGPVPITETAQVPLKETEIGPVPQHWEVASLGSCIVAAQYGLSMRGAEAGQVPILRMNNLIGGKVSTTDLQFVNLDESTKQKFRLNRGDILFNRTNSFELVGKTSVFDLEGDFVFASYLIRLVPDGIRIRSGFLNFYLNRDTAQRRLKGLASRAVSQSNISASRLRGLTISRPPLPEQKEIGTTLSWADHKIEAEEKRKTALQALFKTMLHHLMSGKIRVKDL